MEKEKPKKDEGILKVSDDGKFLVTKMWKYSLIIALALIVGYLLLVVMLICPIIFGGSKADVALETIKTITTVFGPWIAALVAFYFAGKQLETVSEQLGKAQETIAASIKPDYKRVLERKCVKDIMDPFDPNKHKIPHPELENGKINSKEPGPLDEGTIKAIVSHVESEKRKDVKCFAVFKPDGNIEGIITRKDIENIKKEGKGKLLEDLTTDIGRLVKVEPTQTLGEIYSSATNFQVLPVFEGEKIVGFVYREDIFKLMGGVL